MSTVTFSTVDDTVIFIRKNGSPKRYIIREHSEEYYSTTLMVYNEENNIYGEGIMITVDLDKRDYKNSLIDVTPD